MQSNGAMGLSGFEFNLYLCICVFASLHICVLLMVKQSTDCTLCGGETGVALSSTCICIFVLVSICVFL